ncbi:MAG: pilus assembly protein [Armatimonadetes bacterium]|nr:pilus assembly protein [Armatimonadota bacterium]
MKQLRSARLTRKRGTATIEFALVLPVLCMLFLGVLELGMMVVTRCRLDEIARAAVRAAAAGESYDRIMQRVQVLANGLDMDRLQVTVEYRQYLGMGEWDDVWTPMQSQGESNTISLNSQIRVTAVYEYHALVPGLVSFMLDDPEQGTKTIASQAAMHRT